MLISAGGVLQGTCCDAKTTRSMTTYQGLLPGEYALQPTREGCLLLRSGWCPTVSSQELVLSYTYLLTYHRPTTLRSAEMIIWSDASCIDLLQKHMLLVYHCKPHA